MKYLDHIGIAVADLEKAIDTYERLLGTPCYKRETIVQQRVETAFFRTGESKVELLAATKADSVVARYIAQKGEGVHHVAFEVADIDKELDRLQSEGFRVLSEEPSEGADNKRVAFVHPKDNHGVLVELCQSLS